MINVSIPSNGSIQFLLESRKPVNMVLIDVSIPSNGSIQFLWKGKPYFAVLTNVSQSPLTGQFNFYYEFVSTLSYDSHK